MSRETRFKCAVCGKLTAGRVPRAHGRCYGDGTLRYPRMHKGADGETCEGSWDEAEWVDVETEDDDG